MSRTAPAIYCSADQLRELQKLSRSRTEEVRLVQRAKIILHAAEGLENKEIARRLGMRPNSVGTWRKRFTEKGLAGLRDLPRPGAPVIYPADTRERILKTLEAPPPEHLGRWDGPAVAQALGIKADKVWEVLRTEGICLARQRSWCVSTDANFAAKAADIVGLYLNPPFNALVLSVDEKPSIQALTRPAGYVKTSDGKVVQGLKSTYKRNGTLNLFAALEVASGVVHAETTDTKKREDFQRFMDQLLAELPQDKDIHVILDNYCTHKKNEQWLARYENRVIFHFTPTSASWLNMVEIFFGILSRKALRGASFPSKEALRDKLLAFIAKHNEQPKPFQWRKREVKGSQLRNTIINLAN